jgi:predicted nuclease of predicted toxin-antitoxin system
MKFLCDVHISYRLVKHLRTLGFTVIHVNEILNNWFTSDNMISKFADENDLIVITKDSDFRNSFYIKKSPKKLIKINLGNISNELLIQIITDNLEHFKKLNNNQVFIVEVDKTSIQFNVLKKNVEN